ncbi:nucleotide exchange factor GrpE (plasmid) [Bacillus sp. 31A1R]|uniref:Protein GrpE n=1 Tax=Robertmurraya mangrovi TaxID=3098077 RepID=A0ABU5IUU9_9BACI|nr:nucleotide exchange factor GrpE [Bacillus sp. 31A1R]MDZ5470929.1 nucleotide exchange factor GrpE [Bacillus sp. 31A1R]
MTEEKNSLHEELQTAIDENSEEVVEPVFAEEEVVESGQEEATAESNELKSAQERIVELEAKLEETENRYLRLNADFDNSRRRSRLDLEATQKYRAQSLITDLLPALDNFERALQIEADNEQTKSLLQGMEMTYRSLQEALKREGVEIIEAKGKPFDPNLHQAVMTVEDSNFEPNVVVEEFQKGYKLKDRVIRPTMVKVNQ